jgi:hypothetical protein
MTKPNTPVIAGWTWDAATKLAHVEVEGDEGCEIRVCWEDNLFSAASGFLGSRTGSGQIVAQFDHQARLGNLTLNGPVSLFPQAVSQAGEYSDIGTPCYSMLRSLTASLHAEGVHRVDGELHFFITGIVDYHQVVAFAVVQGGLVISAHRGAGEQVVSGLDDKLGYIFICLVLDELRRRIDGIFIMEVPALSIEDRGSPAICPRRNNYI